MTNDDKTLANVFFVVVGVSHVILISFGGHVGAFFLSLLVSGVLCSLAHYLLARIHINKSCDTNVTSRHLGKVLRECARALSP